MRQENLFDSSPTDDVFASRMHRRGDPATSKAGASHIASSGGYLRGLFLDALRKSGNPMTANEVASAVVSRVSGVMAESVRKRAKELEQSGEVASCGVRACIVTGRLATTYTTRESNGDE